MKKKKGSLLIAITLLSVILLIILMTIFNLNKKDAELIAIKGDKEKALQSSNIGLKMAAKDIEEHINKKLQKNESITWNDLYQLKGNTSSREKIDGHDEYRYEYEYKNGQIKATGIYKTGRTFGEKEKKDSSERVYSKTILTANYLMDYVGVQASSINAEIREEKGNYSNPCIKGVYSYDTQYPMKPWINMYDNTISKKDNENRTIKDDCKNVDKILSEGYVTKEQNPLGLYSFTNDPASSDFEASGSGKNINSLDKLFNMCASLDLKSSPNNKLLTDDCKDYKWMVFSIKKEVYENWKLSRKFDSESDFIDWLVDALLPNVSGKKVVIFYRQLKVGVMIHDTLGGYLTDEDYSKKVLDSLGVKGEQIKPYLKAIKTKETEKYGGYVLYRLKNGKISNEDSIKDVYRLRGRNVILIPINSTVVIDGDLILEPEEGYKSFYKTVYDLKKGESSDKDLSPQKVNSNFDGRESHYPVLLVTGNLVVNGSIKGVGTVMSMKNVIINNFPYSIDKYKFKSNSDYEDYMEYYNDPEKGAIIVHANGRLAINSCEVNQLFSQKDLSRLMMSKDAVEDRKQGITGSTRSYNFFTYDREFVANTPDPIDDVDNNTSGDYANRGGEGKNGYQIKPNLDAERAEEQRLAAAEAAAAEKEKNKTGDEASNNQEIGDED